MSKMWSGTSWCKAVLWVLSLVSVCSGTFRTLPARDWRGTSHQKVSLSSRRSEMPLCFSLSKSSAYFSQRYDLCIHDCTHAGSVCGWEAGEGSTLLTLSKTFCFKKIKHISWTLSHPETLLSLSMRLSLGSGTCEYSLDETRVRLHLSNFYRNVMSYT